MTYLFNLKIFYDTNNLQFSFILLSYNFNLPGNFMFCLSNNYVFMEYKRILKMGVYSRDDTTLLMLSIALVLSDYWTPGKTTKYSDVCQSKHWAWLFGLCWVWGLRPFLPPTTWSVLMFASLHSVWFHYANFLYSYKHLLQVCLCK